MAKTVKKIHKILAGIFTSLAGLLLSGCPATLYGPVADTTDLCGDIVNSSSVGVGGIKVELTDLSLSTTSQSDGFYYFSDLPEGGDLTIKATDVDGTNNGSYKPKTVTVSVEENSDNIFNITLEEE